jgi:DNA (cytosine-5)-methyltransferase 1
MFGLDIPRHRLFESSFEWDSPAHLNCRGIAKRAAARRGWEYRDMSVTGKGRRVGTSDRWRELLGINWPTTQHELAESIPPAYTEYIGKAMIARLPS